MEKVFVNDDPSNHCFGCSPHNEAGLGLSFVQLEDGSVECRHVVAERFTGPPGVVHGGIQATLLDEVMAVAARVGAELELGAESGWSVTADMQIRFRRPVPVGEALVVRARLTRIDGANRSVAGQILGPDREVLTEAEGRFKNLGAASE